MLPHLPSRRVSGRYPPAGTSQIADRIRERRGARGLTPLDGALLHVPEIANGFNTLLGAVRTKGNLPGNIRELMILRVAAHNHATYEWVHHEMIGRQEGLTTPQLLIIRDVANPVLPASEPSALTTIQAAALAFSDGSTKDIKVAEDVVQALKSGLRELVKGDEDRENKVEDLYAEAALVVATYNMVSRILLSLDVAGMMDEPVPWPADHKEYTITLPTSTHASPQTLHVTTIITAPSAPYILFSNSLLTTTAMWQPLLSYLLTPPRRYNIILYDHRGHGKSTVPHPPTTALSDLADDIALVLDHLDIPKLHAAIGVSQGGATVLNFALRHPERTKCAVACDTQAVTPEANKAAWDERIALAKSTGDERAGMALLGIATAGRWFPQGSAYHPEGGGKVRFILDMIEGTSQAGFEAGARSLQDYDLMTAGLLDCRVPTLLVAGEKDGGGKIASGLQKLKATWAENGGEVEYFEVEGSGHLPMVDGPQLFWQGVESFLTCLNG